MVRKKMVEKTQKRTQVERREQAETSLFEAGIRLASERGFDGFSLAEVGTLAGYSRGLPTHYFGSKQNYQEQLMKFIINMFKTRQSVPSPKTGLSAIAQTIENAFEMPDKDTIYARILLIMLADKSGKLLAFSEFSEFRLRTIANIERDIRQGIKDGYIRPDVSPNLISLILIETICSAIQLALNDEDIDLKDTGRELTQFILHGIAAT